MYELMCLPLLLGTTDVSNPRGATDERWWTASRRVRTRRGAPGDSKGCVPPPKPDGLKMGCGEGDVTSRIEPYYFISGRHYVSGTPILLYKWAQT